MKIIERFEIPYFQYLTAESTLSQDAPALAKDFDTLTKLYRLMVLVRMMDTKAIALQRTGKLGTYPSTRGQEAIFVGIGDALQKQDIFVPYYRDMGTLIQRGVKLSQILLYWGGDERGNYFHPKSRDFPYSVPIGTQSLHAAGAAFALKYRNEAGAVLAMCGDGATSQGDFYEALNVAAVWQLPVVFVVANNQWAISIPREQQTAAQTLAQKAIAAGFVGEQLDGNDMIAVRERTALALQRARDTKQPALLEMVCYRQSDHTTADDASRYEPQGLREKEWAKEPIARLQRYLMQQGAWDEAKEAELQASSSQEIDAAVHEYLTMTPQTETDMFDYLYASLPPIYQPQRDQLLAEKESATHG